MNNTTQDVVIAILLILRVPKCEQNRQYGQCQHTEPTNNHPKYRHHFGLNIHEAAESMCGTNFLGFVLPCSLYFFCNRC